MYAHIFRGIWKALWYIPNNCGPKKNWIEYKKTKDPPINGGNKKRVVEFTFLQIDLKW